MNQPDVDVRALARLARIAVSDEDIQALEKEIPAILAFVATVQEVAGAAIPEPVPGDHRNVMRADEALHIPGAHTEKLLDAAPATEEGYLRVKQVITGGKHQA